MNHMTTRTTPPSSPPKGTQTAATGAAVAAAAGTVTAGAATATACDLVSLCVLNLAGSFVEGVSPPVPPLG